MSVRVCTLANGAVVGTVAAAPKRAVVVEWCGAVAAVGEVVAAGAEAGTVTVGTRVAATAPFESKAFDSNTVFS